ncbi:MAG: fucose isomerase [Oscillospiraceae bacterium]|nr:fucose isomerase [Oscillospiraceae bacterium]
MSFSAVYIPIGVPTFHLESAKSEFDKSISLLKAIDVNISVPDEMLLSVDLLNNYLSDKSPDIAIVQNLTFANGAYIAEVLRRFNCPVLLWTLREPVIDGTRLRLNSLTGAFSAANMMMNFKRAFTYVFGSPEESYVKNKIEACIRSAKLITSMKNLRVLQIGHTPQGFGFGRALDRDVLSVFGSELISIEARELINKAKAYSADDIKFYLDDAKKRISGLNNINEDNVHNFARLYKAYSDFVKENGIGALSSRCWPDFFVDFGTPVCSVLGIMNDLGIPAACEADTYGAITMYIAQYLTGKPAFFGDPVSMDENENTVTFWHCGMAPCSLARKDTGARAGVHCNRKIGPTLEFGCEGGMNATILRLGQDENGEFRIFAAAGDVLDKPQQFYGTSVVVKPKSNAFGLINRAVKDGWEPHFAVAMGDITEEAAIFGKMLGIKVIEY